MWKRPPQGFVARPPPAQPGGQRYDKFAGDAISAATVAAPGRDCLQSKGRARGFHAPATDRPAPESGELILKRIRSRTTLFTVAALAGLLLPVSLAAQASAVAPEAKAASAVAQKSAWQMEFEARLLVDFPWLNRFKEADLKMAAPAAGENRVVFMGDSITDFWKIEGADGSFPGKPYINRGISGQTTPQMVLRFRQDVIALKPKVVVILGGTNDLAGNTGPMTLEQTEGNLASMADLATANHIRVVLCSVTPAFDFPWKPGLKPAPKILALNAWIKAYAAEKGYVYVDYHTAMKDSRGGLPASLSADGVHPLPPGYAVMTPLAEKGIEKALEGRH
jgi:lysophospholipase L1-like esterase